MSRGRLMNDYLTASPIHGFPDIANAGSKVFKVLWLIIVGAALAYCGYQIVKVLIIYNEQPMTTKIGIRKVDNLPVIKVCQRQSETLLNDQKFREKCPGEEFDYDMFAEWLRAIGSDMSFFEFSEKWEGDDDEFSHFYESQCASFTDFGEISSTEDLMVKYKSFFEARLFNILYIEKPCFRLLLRDIRLESFKEMILASYTPSQAVVGYLVGSSLGGVEEGLKPLKVLDSGDGVCEVFNLSDSKFGKKSSTIRVSLKNDAHRGQIKVYWNDEVITDYTLYGSGNQAQMYTFTATDFRRKKNCIQESRNEQILEINECRNKAMYGAVKCCMAGRYSESCPSDAKLCTGPHVCEAMKSSEFRKDIGECRKLEDDVPCNETLYIVAARRNDYPLSADDGMIFIDIDFANRPSVLQIEDIPLMTSDQALSNIGGVLGLFVGGSIMSVVQIIMFCITRMSGINGRKLDPSMTVD